MNPTKNLIEALKAQKKNIENNIYDEEYNVQCDRTEAMEEDRDWDEGFEPAILPFYRDQLKKVEDLLAFFEANNEEFGYLWD